jgi:hypothetical protein
LGWIVIESEAGFPANAQNGGTSAVNGQFGDQDGTRRRREVLEAIGINAAASV